MHAATRMWPAGTKMLQRLGRPTGITENTRWLFACLALGSLALSLPGAFQSPDGRILWLAAIASATLATAWIYSYLSQGVPPWLDLLETAALLGFTLACPSPNVVIPIIFSAMWFRALYGSTWRSLRRCCLYVIAFVVAIILWNQIPGHIPVPASDRDPRALPLLFLTVIVGRQLGRGLLAREQSLTRNTVLANTGSQLLGLTDTAAIRSIGWKGAVEISAASTGLRLIRVAEGDGGRLVVTGAAGGFQATLSDLPTALFVTDGLGETAVADAEALNQSVGTPLDWVVIDLPELPTTWLLVGSPRGVSPESSLAIRSLVNQVALALSNSDVHQELTVQASVDSLTGLANRAAFSTELSTQLTSRRDEAGLYVFFLDLDDFKNVNDVLGHHAGDLLLIEVAARLRRCTRPSDLCARLGGDEFAVILRGSSDMAAMDVAQRTVDAIAAPMQLGEHTARVGASIGVAAGVIGMSLEELVHQADVAMYAAKAHGKGRTRLFNPDLLQADTSRQTFELELADAADAGQLVVHYQPILSLTDLRCTAVEALVRWQHPSRGLVPPANFIEIAEHTGAILELGTFVLRQACADAVVWQQAHPGAPLAMHVNVSAKQLDDAQFIATVRQILAETGLAPGDLVLELTETAVLDASIAIPRLLALAELGIQIALDDFGTGYSSLSTLRSLPVSILKLDRTFIAGALSDASARTVITAIVRMSHELGLYTIAEGVERTDQRDFLEGIGTDAVQGYLHLRPVAADEFATWLSINLGEPASPGSVVLALAPRRSA